jgi:hypothetical protein
MEGIVNIFVCNVCSYGDKEEGFQVVENDESDDSRVFGDSNSDSDCECLAEPL